LLGAGLGARHTGRRTAEGLQPLLSGADRRTGIGLNVAREIVQMHGGDIFVDSSEALGSVFKVSFPISGALAAPQAA
jgi:signal transduction histidine kinase